MAIDRLSPTGVPTTKVVKTGDLEEIIYALEDVAYRKAAQCTPLALYNRIPELKSEQIHFPNLNQYYQHFLSSPLQKPYPWYIGKAMYRINLIRRKEIHQIMSTRRVRENEDGSITQMARVVCFNELGWFRIHSNINVTTGEGTNRIAFLPVSNEEYPKWKEKYKAIKGYDKNALEEVQEMFAKKRYQKSKKTGVQTLATSFVVDKNLVCDTHILPQIKEAVEKAGGIEKVAFFDTEWFQSHPLRGDEDTCEEMETCYQVGYCHGVSYPTIEEFCPVNLHPLDIEKHKQYMERVGVTTDHYKSIIENPKKADDVLLSIFEDMIKGTNLLMASSEKDMTLLSDFLDHCEKQGKEVSALRNIPKMTTDHIFTGYFVPKIQTLARIGGMSDSVHSYNAGEDAVSLATAVCEMVKHDSIEEMLSAHEDSIREALTKFFENGKE